MAITDPFRNFRFRVEINGIQSAGFSEATIPDTSTDPIDYREGTDPTYQRKLSGLTKYGNVTLKRGLTTTMDLYKWRQTVEKTGAASARQNISIILIDDTGNDQCRWDIINAWPTKYENSGFSGNGNEVMIETLEITLEQMTRVK